MRRVTWSHPEWWVLAASGVAWVALVSGAAARSGIAGHSAHASPLAGTTAVTAWAAGLPHLALMLAAMMLPLVVGPVRIAAFRSLWRRRHVAIVEFLAGYLTTWMIVAVAASAVGSALAERLPAWVDATWGPAAIGFAIAAIWQMTARKRRALRSCHQAVPLAPTGWRAHADCLRFGVVNARQCLMNCWALMLAALLAPHSVWIMAGVTAICAVERYRRRPPGRAAPLAWALAAVALVCATAGGWQS